MIKAVLFDLDGTLLNRDSSIQKFIDKQYEGFLDALGHIAKEAYTKRFKELDSGGYIWKDQVYQQLVDEFDISSLTWESLLEDYVTQFRYSCIPFPNLVRTLEALKKGNILLGIITNGNGQFQMDNIKALGIENYFDIILISEWEGLKKPDERIFEKALKNLHVSPNECLFVGDHPENDVKAAQNVEMKSVWKKNAQRNNVEADYIVDDLFELFLMEPLITNKLL